MVQASGGGWALGALRLVAQKPASRAPSDGIHQLLDLQGDGRLDLVRYAGPMSGYFEQTGTYGGRRTGFSGFRTFSKLPNIDFSEPDLRFLDVTGDGRGDLLVTRGDLIIMYRSNGAEGFEPERRMPLPRDEEGGPRIVFSDAHSAVLTADMTGDGLSDIVRIENGRVSYWPNQGLGYFGPKVTMRNAPRLDRGGSFDPSRIRLADLDGSGPADLIYLEPDGIVAYLNEAGNGWALGLEVRGLPLPSALADVQTVDLLGRGTTFLVWSSRAPGESGRMVSVDLLVEVMTKKRRHRPTSSGGDPHPLYPLNEVLSRGARHPERMDHETALSRSGRGPHRTRR